jgi:hypothetical protein
MYNNTQKLVDIVFQIALTMKNNNDWVEKSTEDEIIKWVSEQLSTCGYCTRPIGSSFGLLTEK